MAGSITQKDSTRIYMNTTTPVKADKLSNVVSIGEIGAAADEVDTTTIDSVAKENVGGMDDNGEVALVLNIVDTELTKLMAWQKDKTKLKWGVVADDADGDAIISLSGSDAWIKSCKWNGATVGGLLQVSATMRLSGELLTTYTEPTI